jgi:hypothetical protein
MKKLLVVAFAVVFALVGVGCKEKSPTEKGAEAVKAVKVPEAPDQVVNEAVKAVKEGNLIAVYAMLPDSYQKDVQDLYGKIAAKIDAEMYGKLWTLIDKGFAAIKKNKDKVGEGAPMPIDQILTPVEEFLALAKEMKLSDAEAMKALNVAAFLADNGKKLSDFGWKTAEAIQKEKVAETKKMLDGIKAVAKETKENEATVTITMMDQPQDVVFVKVEGKWIPKDLADQWPKMKEEANKKLDAGLAEFEKNKEEMKKMLAGFEEALTKFDASGKLEDLGPVMGAMQGL